MLFVVGPSHVPRWRHVIENVGYPGPVGEIVYVGDGGYPVWNRSMLETVSRRYKPGDRVFLIVSDFRFGNARLRAGPIERTAIFADGFTHVNRTLISLTNDLRMKSLALAALSEWRRVFGDDLLIFHWTLAMQAVQNRLDGRYVDMKGNYHHPLWNVGEFSIFANDVEGIELFAEEDANRLKSLYIDRDLHPSPLGFLYMNEVLRTRNHVVSFSAAFQVYREAFGRLFEALSAGPVRRVAIFGDSCFIEVLQRIVPLEFRRKLEMFGVYILDYNRTTSLVNLFDLQLDEILFVSRIVGSHAECVEQVGLLRNKYQAVARHVSVLPWEMMFAFAVKRRGGYRSGIRTPLLADELASLQFAASLDFRWLIEEGGIDRFVDHGAGAGPTLAGVFYVLSTAAGVEPLVDAFPSRCAQDQCVAGEKRMESR